jgi:hypothetical protein
MNRATPRTAPPSLPVELDDGRRLTCLDRIGKGTSATVYRSVLEGSGRVQRLVALKLFDVIASDEYDVVVPRIGKAVRRAARIQHPNVVATYEFGAHGRQPIVVSELVEGRSLSDLLDAYASRKQKLPPDIALFIALEVAEALQGAAGFQGDKTEAQRRPHGDLSAREVLLSWYGEVKVSDFGIRMATSAASAVRSRTSISRRAVTLAPEVAQGDKPDVRADVFALGALLHVMLVGPRFAPGLSDEQVLTLAMEGSFQRRLFGPRLPLDIDSLLERSTVADPDRRLGDPTVFAYELRRAALALGVGDGRMFLRRAMQAAFGERADLDLDGPTCPEKRPPVEESEEG